MIVPEGPPRGVTGRLVLPEAVVQNGAYDVREVDQHAQAAFGRLPRGFLDQFGASRSWPRQAVSIIAVNARGRPGHLSDQAVFFEEPCRGAQLTPKNALRRSGPPSAACALAAP